MPDSQKLTQKNISKLIKLNDELENYFKNTIIPQLFVDANLILRKYTPPAMNQFKFTPEHIGKSIEELSDNIRYSTLIDDIRTVIKQGEIFEKEIQTTDLKWFQMNIIPYIVSKTNKANGGVIITFVDITQRINDIRELEKLNAARETFIYTVSHDLKGPLNNIEGLISLLTEWGNDEKEQKDISDILNKSVKIMKNIIDELAEITKIEGNYKEHIDIVDFREIFKEVELIIKDKIIENKAQIHYDIKETEIRFSRKNIRSIVYNLISNAIKYKSLTKSPQLNIEVSKEDDFVVITIKDNGLGIAEDQIDQMFLKFTRIENNVEGTGIGLYLVKKIIDNHGGKIIVNSIVGEGSEFKVYLKNEM